MDIDPSGKYILCNIPGGISEISLADSQFIPLRHGIYSASIKFAPDGKSFLYPVFSHVAITFYRQGWSEGKLLGEPKPALELPFVFRSYYGGNAYATCNAYDFTRDLSSVVYTRPSLQADLYYVTPAP
jgi:hypothetical protein